MEQFELRFSIPGSTWLFHTKELGTQRQITIGTGEDCQKRIVSTGNFSINLTRGYEQWTISQADQGTRLYNREPSGKVEEKSVCQLTDGGLISVCCMVNNEMTEVMQIAAEADRTDQINTEYDLRINLGDQNAVTIGAEKCMLSFDRSYVLNQAVTLRKAGDRWMVEQDGKGQATINTTVIIGRAPLQDHDFLTLGGARLYYLEGSLFTSSKIVQSSRGLKTIPVKESAGALSYPIFMRSTRIQHQVENNQITLQQPTNLPQQAEDSLILRLLPSVTMLFSMILMRAGQGGNGLIMALYMGASMGSSILVTILTRKDQKKKFEAEALNRKNRYFAYMQEKIDEIARARQDELRILERIYRSEDDNMNIVRNFDKGLFDRSPQDPDFLDIRLGRGRREAEQKVTTNTPELRQTDDELVDMAENVIKQYRYLDNAPIVTRLSQYGAIGVVGRRKWLYEMLKIMTLDLVVRHYYRDVKFYYVLNEEDCEQFSWVRWLQNCMDENGSGQRTILYDDESKKLYLESLYRILSSRAGLSGENRPSWPEYYVIFVYRIDVIRNHPISQYFEQSAGLGVRFIFMDENEERIPRGCGEMIRLDTASSTGTIFQTRAAEQATTFEYNTIMGDRMNEMVRKLAPVRVVESNLANEMTKSITLYQLLGVSRAKDLDFGNIWKSNNVVKSLSVPLGVRTKNAIQYLDIHEKAHGPHGLVAGTTGSGKSEILQSYLINLAVYFPPDEVNYLLIDFKGGGMSNLFEGLPHLTGAITDIDGREIERSLKAIRAELERRKRLFEKAKVNKIDDYIRMRKQDPESVPVALPHLIIVVDEFAELKAEQPDFMKELISTARVGRSLGVHLILATQKPSGVVDPQIVSNSRFRLCLKVAGKDDSNEMIGTPLAAEIREPGRAYLQVGNNEIFELFQSAYSGGAEPSSDASTQTPYVINELNMWGRATPVYRVEEKKDESGETIRRRSELEAIRDTIIEYCAEKGIEPLQKVCMPPMPALISLDTLGNPAQHEPGSVVIHPAMYDDPEEHYQGPYAIDLSQNNMFLVGVAQMGKTEALISIIHQAIMNYDPSQVNFYLIDAGNMALNMFDGSAHVGAVVDYRDEDLVENTMKFLRQTMEARRSKMMASGVGSYQGYCAMGKTDMPLAVLVIDNVAAFREYYEKYDETLQALAREGMSAGITMILTGNALNNLHYRMQPSFGLKICFTLNDPTEYSAITNVRRFEPHRYPGCGLAPLEKRVVEVQFGLASHPELDPELAGDLETEEGRNRALVMMERDDKRRADALRKAIRLRARESENVADRVPVVPVTLLLEETRERYPKPFRQPYQLVVGMEYSSVELISVSLLNQPTVLVSTRQNEPTEMVIPSFLRQMEESENSRYEVFILDGMRHTLSPYRNLDTVQLYTNDVTRMQAEMQNIIQELKQRQDALYSAEDEKREALFDSWSMKVVIINEEKVISNVTDNKDWVRMIREMLTEYNDCKCAILWGRYPNIRPGYGDDITKTMTETGTIIFSDKIANLKLADSSGTYRTLKRTYAAGDAYICQDGSFMHVKAFCG